MPGAEAIGPILALSMLLVAGFAGAILARLVRLPSVTGYVVGGMLIGPAGFDLLPSDLLESQLGVFTGIALMLVAFGIGERFELQQLRQSARAVARVSIGESLGAFCLVVLGVTFAASVTKAGGQAAGISVWLATGLICGSIAVATAPASTSAVIRELRASGPLSRLTLSTVVVNNALSITLFGLTAGAAKVLIGTADASVVRMAEPLFHALAALTVGLAIGLATDIVVHKLTAPGDVLVVALAGVFFTGGLAAYLGLSPLLAGVAAGFAVVNRDRRDVRAFRALNDFEPPLYAIFFALAGAELQWGEMLAGGGVGLSFVLARAVGKYLGARLGANSADVPKEHAQVVGLGLLPQAGLAIGLAVLVSQDQALAPIRALIINVTVASVVVNELVGPPLLRFALLRARETAAEPGKGERRQAAMEIDIVPWRWPRLQAATNPRGRVIAALGSPATAAGIVRVATLLAHHFEALPMAVYIGTQPGAAGGFWSQADEAEAAERFGMRWDTVWRPSSGMLTGLRMGLSILPARAGVTLSCWATPSRGRRSCLAA
jgi:Kef-type K+ transport system membrane component KefB